MLARLLGDSGGGRLAIGETASVPAGRYAKAALESLGVWTVWSGRLARTDNVRAALLLVARGEAALGVVYVSDAMLEPRVRVLASIAPACHPPIRYPAAVLKDASHPRAEEALRVLGSESAQSRFARAGFATVPEARASSGADSGSASSTAIEACHR